MGLALRPDMPFAARTVYLRSSRCTFPEKAKSGRKKIELIFVLGLYGPSYVQSATGKISFDLTSLSVSVRGAVVVQHI